MISLNFKYNFTFFIKIIFVCLFICLKSYADDTKPENNMTIIGSYDANIKIKIYSSLTCPHCANFHNKIVPKIKKEYVDPGIVQLIFMDFPLDQAAFNASKLLHCLNQEKKITYLDTIYENQNKWTTGSNIDEINNNLKKIVKDFGIDPNQFDKCLSNESISDKILSERIDANKKYSIDSTPTIIINEEKLDGSATFKNIKKTIEKII